MGRCAGAGRLGIFLQNASALSRGSAGTFVALTISAAIAIVPFNTVGISFALGFGACALIAWGKTAGWTCPGIQPMADLTFGIYLAHIFVFAQLLKYADLADAAMPFAIFAISAAVVAAGRALAPRLRSYWS